MKPLQKRALRLGRVWRTVQVAAAAAACLLGMLVTAQAAGIDVFGAMVRWTQDVFSFGTIPPDGVVTENIAGAVNTDGAQDQAREFTSLQEALDAYGITEFHEPSWLPEGYAPDILTIDSWDDPPFVSVDAGYVWEGTPLALPS